MDPVQTETLLRRMVDNQAISVRSWMEAFREHRDFSSVRSLTESMARWYGMYKCYWALFSSERGIPESMERQFEEFHAAREEVLAWQPKNT